MSPPAPIRTVPGRARPGRARCACAAGPGPPPALSRHRPGDERVMGAGSLSPARSGHQIGRAPVQAVGRDAQGGSGIDDRVLPDMQIRPASCLDLVARSQILQGKGTSRPPAGAGTAPRQAAKRPGGPGRSLLPPGAYDPRRGSPRIPPRSTRFPGPEARRSARPRWQRSRRHNGQRHQRRTRPIPASACSRPPRGLRERRRSRRRHLRALAARAPRHPRWAAWKVRMRWHCAR